MHDARSALRSRDKRSAFRRDLHLGTTVCSSQIRRVGAEMVDLSILGCRLSTPIALTAGDYLTIAMPGLSPRGARVCWHDRGMIGVRFAQSLHASVVDHLVERSRALRASADASPTPPPGSWSRTR